MTTCSQSARSGKQIPIADENMMAGRWEFTPGMAISAAFDGDFKNIAAGAMVMAMHDNWHHIADFKAFWDRFTKR